MHGETRGVRYFIMHRLTGAELTKLISVKLFYGVCCWELRWLRPGIKRRRI